MIHPEIARIIREQHENGLIDPIYMEGFNASRSARNPYKFPKRTGDFQLKAAVNPCLTQKDKNALIMWGKRFNKTKWARWANGFHNVERIQAISIKR